MNIVGGVFTSVPTEDEDEGEDNNGDEDFRAADDEVDRWVRRNRVVEPENEVGEPEIEGDNNYEDEMEEPVNQRRAEADNKNGRGRERVGGPPPLVDGVVEEVDETLYDFGPLRAAATMVVLVDQTPKLPRGILTDIIVKVEDFYFPVDFLVLDYVSDERTKQPTVILDRPFLATANANINYRNGIVDMAFGNRKLRINVFTRGNNSPVDDECFMADVIDECIPLYDSVVSSDGTAETCFLFDKLQVETDELLEEEERQMEIAAVRGDRPPWSVQENALMEVVVANKEAIGWTIADLKGISPSIMMHKILTDPTVKPAHDAQRRLNPNMREVVKKEELKWLDAGIIFAISDSTWVSPTQKVPKKAGIQVVKDDSGNEVATRPVTGWRICIDYRKLNAATLKIIFRFHMANAPASSRRKRRRTGPRVICYDSDEVQIVEGIEPADIMGDGRLPH
ncbi:uncharacterized protein LOC143563968 [Bidens hawaiensis]|uniref:uncharacterized protein LOC143563968 n=1 Tax=Bidens hawaiensis TaxID=980011 RepID=UPI0040490E17